MYLMVSILYSMLLYCLNILEIQALPLVQVRQSDRPPENDHERSARDHNTLETNLPGTARKKTTRNLIPANRVLNNLNTYSRVRNDHRDVQVDQIPPVRSRLAALVFCQSISKSVDHIRKSKNRSEKAHLQLVDTLRML